VNLARHINFPTFRPSEWVFSISNKVVFLQKNCFEVEDKIKHYLMKRLIEENAFWSFDKGSLQCLSDWNLIKYSLIHLDLEDISYLFSVFSKRMIKKVWIAELIPQGDYLRNMNLCFALLLFDAKRPLVYVKSLETRKLNKLLKQ
jgi:hypothetical protein